MIFLSGIPQAICQIIALIAQHSISLHVKLNLLHLLEILSKGLSNLEASIRVLLIRAPVKASTQVKG